MIRDMEFWGFVEAILAYDTQKSVYSVNTIIILQIILIIFKI